MLIHNVTIITMDRSRRIIANGAISVDDGRIVEVGKSADLLDGHAGGERLDGKGMVAIPGLIDGHAHADQAILRGSADDLHWVPFLRDIVYPLLDRRSDSDVVASFELAMLEMVKSGTTCFVDPNYQPHYDLAKIAAAVEVAGIRAELARCVAPTSEIHASGAFSDLESTREAAALWNGSANGRLRLGLAPEVPRELEPTARPDFFEQLRTLGQEADMRLVFHYSAEPEDVEFYQQQFGQRPVEFADAHGLLGPDVVLVNACWLSDDDIDRLVRTRTSVVHSPSANMKMSSGIARVADMLASGVTVALGTDGGANNNVHDMVLEMKAASLLQNVVRGPGTLTAETALEMGTINGARALGRDEDLGSIEVGKLADLVLVDVVKPHMVPNLDVVSSLVYCATGGDVDTVIVGGEVLLRGGESTRIDEEEILARARTEADRLLERGGVKVASSWPTE